MHKPRLFRGLQVGVVPRLEGLGALWGLLGRAVKYYPTERDQSLWSEHYWTCTKSLHGLLVRADSHPHPPAHMAWWSADRVPEDGTLAKCSAMEEFQIFEILAFV